MRYRGQGFQMSPLLWIIALNVAVFLVLLFAPIIGNFLGMTPVYILAMPWTIFTAMFTHGGFGHLFANMITLFFFGRFLQQVLGEKKFLVLYFIGGLAGNVLYLILALFATYRSPYAPVIGASGAVFALMGMMLAIAPKMRVYLYFFIPLPLWVVIVLAFVILFVPQYSGNIAWEAHLGGLLFGLGYGWYFKRQQARWRW